jgi:hypothetical protein
MPEWRPRRSIVSRGCGRLFGAVIRDTGVPRVLGAIYTESIRHGRDGRVTTVAKKDGHTRLSL